MSTSASQPGAKNKVDQCIIVMLSIQLNLIYIICKFKHTSSHDGVPRIPWILAGTG